MQTSDPDVYAVGDVVQIVNPVTGQQGRCLCWAGQPAGAHRRRPHHRSEQSLSRHRGHGHRQGVRPGAASTGANSAALERQGIAFLTSITHSSDHVAYYPGAKPQAIKLLYTPDEGRILGAQVVGYRPWTVPLTCLPRP